MASPYSLELLPTKLQAALIVSNGMDNGHSMALGAGLTMLLML